MTTKSTDLDPILIFSRTLIGRILAVFRQAGEGLTTREVAEGVESVGDLRRLDGGKYKGGVDRGVLGCLQQNKVFRFEGGKWEVDWAAANTYIEKRLAIISTRKQRASHLKASKKPRKIARLRHTKLVAFLDKTLAACKMDENCEFVKVNPLNGVKDSDEGQKIVEKLGLERAIGIAQAYEIVRRQYHYIYTETSEHTLESSLEKTVTAILKTAGRIKGVLNNPK